MIAESDFTFGKDYKLCSKKTIDQIFEKGSSVKSYPLVLRYAELSNDRHVPFQIVISAPKKIFRSAVKRNRIKRICREAVRMNKSTLESYCNRTNKQLALFLIYTDQTELPVSSLTNKVKKIFEKLISKIEDEETK